MDKKRISFIVPCYNEEENIPITYKELTKTALSLENYDYEIIFINNGSEDRSEELIKEITKKDPKVIAVLLSRNFGPESSALAGLHHANGDAIICIEADLQDPVELIPEFVKKWEAGFDIVLGRRDSGEEGKIINYIRKIFYKILKKVSYIDIPVNVGGFSLFDKKVNNAMNRLDEKNRFVRAIRSWVGFKSCQIPYERRKRKYGKSSYNSIFAYMRHAEKGLISFSNLPLELLTYVGMILVLISIITILIYIILFFTSGNPITASATIFLSIFFFGSIQILAISIIGKYIAIIFEETKNRPHYIVKELINYKN